MPSDRPALLSGASTSPGPLRPRDPRRVGRFRIRARLGTGAMGTVFLGTDVRGRRVAIKLLRDEYTDDAAFRIRFRREVAAASQVHGPWIARLVDADAGANPPWMATEYVEGPTLSQAVGLLGPLPRDAVLDLVRGVARALDEIHAAGLVHRDVKPGNVILGPHGPRLIDLGVVGIHDATRLTTTGTPIGTPACMSPEQASSGEVGPSSDIWSLAGLAFYAATGRYLYTGQNAAALLYQVVHERPDVAGAPDHLLPLLDACLRRDPAARPTAAQVLDLLGPEPAHPRAAIARYAAAATTPPEAAGPLERLSRRHAVVAMVALAALAGSAAGVIAWAPRDQGAQRLAGQQFVVDGTEAEAAAASGTGDPATASEQADEAARPDPSPRPTAGGSAEPTEGGGTADPPGATASSDTEDPHGPTTSPDGAPAPPGGGEPVDPVDPAEPEPTEAPPPAAGTATFLHGTVGKCLTDTAGGNPSLTACDAAPGWETAAFAGGADQVRHPVTGECLSVDGYRNLTSAPCDGSALQDWRVLDHGVRFGLQNAATGECVNVNITHDVTTVAEANCGERAGQLWTGGTS